MANAAYIAEIWKEANSYGAGKLNWKERSFLESIYAYSRKPTFTALSPKQETWFNALARKQEATKGKYAFQVISERSRQAYRRYRESYYVASMGW